MPPEAPHAWVDIIQPEALSRLEPIVTWPVRPVQRRRRTHAALRLALLVVLPTLLSGFYFGLIATDRYLAEARFVIRKPNAPEAPNRGASQSLSIEEGPKVLGEDDGFAVRDFLLSRDALRLLLARADLRSALMRGGSDWLWRFPSPLTGYTDEDLYALYQALVDVDYDSSSGVTTLRAQAFQAVDATRMATVLIGGAEALLNRLNERARTDSVRIAEAEVQRTQQQAMLAQDRVTAFRDREAVIDPTKVSETVLSTIAELSLTLVENRAQLEVTRQASPNSPQIPLFRTRLQALQQQIDHERATLAGGDRALAPRIAEYERLPLQRSFA